MDLVHSSEQLNGSPTLPLKRRPKTAESEVKVSNPFTWPMRMSGGVGDPGAPIEVYKKVQRSHSSQNNYDEVRIRI